MGRGLSEQLLPGLLTSNLTGLPRQALAIWSPGIYLDGRIHHAALPISHEVQEHSPDGRGGSKSSPESPPGRPQGGLETLSFIQPLAPLAAAPSSSLRGAPLRLLPATEIGFLCPSRRCQNNPLCAKASGYLQHLNQ